MIDENTKIYVAAPAGVATGGPELLHQLVYHLRNDLGHDAYMYYYPSTSKNPVHPAYRDYNNPFVCQIADEPQNILIVPEVVSGVQLLSRYKKLQKVIWWLSVNNFLISAISANKLSRFTLVRVLNKVASSLGRGLEWDAREAILTKLLPNKSAILKLFKIYNIYQANLHMCQSYYAMDFLTSMSIKNKVYLSDYINKEFLKQNFNPKEKADIVAFNPKKGRMFTKQIMTAGQGIDFVPIEKMSRTEVIDLLRKAKVYIDFGDHPGKDRIPREAAILGCCVIVGKRGSAANERDMPIPSKYKFEVTKANIPAIIKAILFCLENYEKAYREFDEYRMIIKKEPERFFQDLGKIFGVEKKRESVPKGVA
jgi:hypothetical protein